MKRKQLKFMKCGRNNDNFANFSYKLQDFQNIETNHRLYIDRGSVYWEQQASWENCTILEKLGLFVYVFLNTSYFSSASFVYFFYFVYILGGKYLSISQIIQVVLKCTPAKCVLYLYEPHLLLGIKISCKMSWLIVYLCLWNTSNIVLTTQLYMQIQNELFSPYIITYIYINIYIQ